jgi:hypothetical protein
MFEQPDPRADAKAGLTDSRQNEAPPADGASPDSRIEDYLDHVCAPLVGLVPYARRQELRAELRGHLDALVGTHEELGSERDVAVVMALRQFGPPREISHQWAREWIQGNEPAGVQSPWRAMRIALISFGAAALLGLALLAVLMLSPASYFGEVGPPVMLGLVGIALPVAAGLITGLFAPVRHALGVFYALAVLILPSVALTWLSLRQPAGTNTLADCGGMLALAQCVSWAPIGCGAAELGGRLRARLALRPRRWVLR